MSSTDSFIFVSIKEREFIQAVKKCCDLFIIHSYEVIWCQILIYVFWYILSQITLKEEVWLLVTCGVNVGETFIMSFYASFLQSHDFQIA